mmetsp:Transcript_19416/g.41482  ORF Transcript_19416/g.41482 Transcript_19416/m.41482 type:complete len:1071 (-) Transcript_19416:20-3232(-)
MKILKKKVDINDLRADKGGDPDLYRRVLASSSSSPQPSSTPNQTDSTGGESSSASSASLVNEALSLDSQRRSSLTSLEGLRSKLSTLQKNVIAPKKKAGGDVTEEVAQLKEWKAEIAKLNKEAKEVERRRNDCLMKINGLLANVSSEEMKKLKDAGSDSAADGKSGTTEAGKRPPIRQSSRLSADAPSFSIPSYLPLTTTTTSTTTATSSTATKTSKTTASSSSASPTSAALPLLSPEQIKSVPPERILNLNVGVLGHVDTGKTSLVKTLSSVLSTAALDKSKQSRARGITLDLGFSAFLLPLPEHLMRAEVVGSVTAAGGGGDGDGKTSNNSKKSDASSNDIIPQPQDASASTTKLQNKYDLLQVTLVDCPGHASLIRTIIGGAQIIDMVLLVVDATKGMQTQTAECLVIAEMTTRNLIVVLNKIDMFPEGEREERLQAAKRKMRAALRGTKFENAEMVGISACVGGEKVAAVKAGGGGGGGAGGNTAAGEGEAGKANASGFVPYSNIAGTNNMHGLLKILQAQMKLPDRDARPSPDRFHFAVDHCFPIKGQGTVLTGTCLSGSARPNDVVEFPTLATHKKVKGLQMFRRKANIVQQGDRAGICVSNFDAKLMERGIIASPGTVKLIRGAIAVVRKVRFFRGGLNSGAKFHVSVGHTTVMATATFWGAREIAEQVEREDEKRMENDNSQQSMGKSSLGGSADLAGLPRLKFDWNEDFVHQDNYLDKLPSSSDGDETKWTDPKRKPTAVRRKRDDDDLPPLHWARLEFLTPVYCPMDSLVIGSRLDSEANANACRLAFSGRLVERYDAKSDHGRLKTYTKKEKVGAVSRLGDPYKRADDGKIVRYEVFGTDLFKKETNMTQFVGLLIETDRGDVGSIQSSFGTSGKFRVNFPGGTDVREGDPLYLRFKRYANDPKKAIHQDGTALPPARTGSRVDPPEKKKKKNKAKNGGKNGKDASSTSRAGAADDGNASSKNNARTANNEAAFGEILKLKGDVLPNGKHTVAIVSGLFAMEDDIRQHKGRRVTSTARPEEEGEVDGSFGKMGKCKVLFRNGISAESVGGRVTMPKREK